MKIPDGNNGAYYGNEEGSQWQPNGVVAGGDAGYHRYPPQGYVMPGGYYDGNARQMDAHDDFSEYMWMENEEEFDKQVMQQLEEEALMEQCIEAMLEDEQRERNRPQNGHPQSSESRLSLEQAVSRSTLNPLAAEFVPTFVRQAVITQDETPPELPGDTPPENIEDTTEKPEHIEEVQTKESEEKPSKEETIEVVSIEEKKSETRKSKRDSKKVQPSKSEPKITSPVTTEVEPTSKSCDRQENVERVAQAQKENKVEPTPVEETPSGPKPINYAAAAKANKPKKATTPPVAVPEKQAPIKMDKQKSVEKVKDKVKVEAKRKNSGK